MEGIRRIPARQWRGELGFLAAISPTVHRLSLEMSDRQASALAAAIAETEAVAPEIAKLRGIALASVFQIIITEAGRRTREGQSQDQIAGELRPAIEAVLDDLDDWLTPATNEGLPKPQPPPSRRQDAAQMKRGPRCCCGARAAAPTLLYGQVRHATFDNYLRRCRRPSTPPTLHAAVNVLRPLAPSMQNRTICG